MSDAVPPPAPTAEAGRVPGTRRRFAWRWSRRALVLVAAAIAAAVAALFTIDLGPAARKRAESEATKYLERPMHIGRLSAYVWPGDFLLEDVIIEGKHPGDRPFLQAKRIRVSVPWLTLLRFDRNNRALFAEVRMTDWKMSIETWPGQGNSLPKFLPRNPSKGPKPFTTTVRHVYALRGDLIYEDHGTPWKVHAPNLNFALVRAENLKSYVGTAAFTDGVVQIQNFLPMRTDFTTRFTLAAPIVRLHHIDLLTDGARSNLSGVVDLAHYPEATYEIDSQIDFARMRELYFANEPWRVNGDGRFLGTFHMFPGGHDLHGRFESPLATLRTPGRTLLFPNLHGALQWVPKRFDVSDAGSDFYGGRSRFSYALAPLGTPAGSTAKFGFQYEGVDVDAFTRGIDWRDIDLRGRASGSNEMTWHNGQFSKTMTGNGHAIVTPPPGVEIARAAVPGQVPRAAPEPVPFEKARPLGPLPVAGEIAYQLDPDGIDIDPSWAATASTYLSFHGRADYGAKSNIAFHVTSLDWQASDRLLAAILSAAGGPTSPVEVGGYGQFDGTMTGPFSQPRVGGHFASDAVSAWGTRWGRTEGDIVIENSYVTVSNGVIGDAPTARILADGRFSLGFPRKDAGEEINGHIRVQNWPLADLRHAFGLDDWPVEGTVTAADLRLTSMYQHPLGSGTLRIDKGSAWGEKFETATSDLRFNGVGLEMSRILMSKDVGQVNGSAFIKWDSTYSFDAQGDRIPVESLTSFTFPAAPLSGVLQFTASGAGSFDSPVYDFKGRVTDLFAGSQGVGDMSGSLQVRNNVLSIPQLDIASSLLQMSATGSIALNATYDSNLTFRFTDSSVDPYLQYIAPAIAPRISQYTRAKISGLFQMQGPLKPADGNTKGFEASATIDDVQLMLLNYELKNDGEVRLRFSNNTVSINRLLLSGTDTKLSLEGNIPASGPMNVVASGSANLAILQGFFPNLISSGAATVSASIVGDRADPRFAGQADITDGRLRQRTFPHGLEQINGPITFDANGLRAGRFNADGTLSEQLRGRMGGGDVTIGGTIAFKGLVPDQFELTAAGHNVRLRYPVGFASTVDANLTLTGPIATPTLGGTVTVLRSAYQQEIDSDSALLELASGGSTATAPALPGEPSEPTFPLRFDIRLNAPGTLAIDTRDAQVFGSANLTVTGTYDTLAILGQVTIDRGSIFFNGNRYTVPRGSILFSNPSKLDPFFDVEFETRMRDIYQTYNVTIRITGTQDKLNPTFTADPFLPTYDLLSLLLGERPDVRNAEERSIRSQQLSQQQVMRTAAAQLLVMPLSSKVGSVIQRTLPCDTFSIVPLLGNEAALQQLNPGARVTCGKRIANRIFLTYSRAVNQSSIVQNEIMLLEYEQSDRMSWIVSRNEDRTYALDFRIRHVF